jgi:hypothetical protein
MAQDTAAVDYGSGDGKFWRGVVGTVALLVLLPVFVGIADVVGSGLFPRLVIPAVVLFGCFWLAFLIHELGHAAAALLVGWRVHVISVTGFAFHIKARKLVPAERFASGDVGGFVLATPPLGGTWRRGEKRFVLGGIAANLSSSLIAFAWAASNTLCMAAETLVGSFGVVSLVVGLVNVVPTWGPNTLRSDGAHLLDSFRGRYNPMLERLTWLYVMRLEGVKAPDIERQIVEQIEADIRDGNLGNSGYLLLTYYVTMGDLTRAHAIIERIVVTDVSDELRIDHAFLVAMVERNGDRARKILDAVKRSARGRSYAYWRAMAVALYMAGDKEAARAAVDSAKIVAARTNAPLDDQDRELLDTVERGETIRIFA